MKAKPPVRIPLFVIPIILSLLGAAAFATAVCPAPPAGCPAGVVCGKNLCPSDIDAVKCAIAATPAGGTITLQGTFNFKCMAGADQSPRLTKTLHLEGNCETTIVGDGVADAGATQETGLRINAGADGSSVDGITWKELDYGIDVIGSATGAKVFDVALTGNRFESVSLQAVDIIHCRNTTFSGNYLKLPATGAQPYGPAGIQNFGSFDTLVEDNVVEGPGSGTSRYAVVGFLDFTAADFETLTQRLVYRGNQAAKVDYAVLTVGEHQQVQGNRFFNLGTGVGTTSALDVVVADNCFESFGGSAVDVGGVPIGSNSNPPGSSGVAVTNNAIAASGKNGVQVRVPSTDVSNDKPFGHLRNLVFLDPAYKLIEVKVGGQPIDFKKAPYKSFVKVGPPATVTVQPDGSPWWTGALPKDMSVKTSRPSPNTSVVHLIGGSPTRPVCSALAAACTSGFAPGSDGGDASGTTGAASGPLSLPPLPGAPGGGDPR